MPTVQGLLRWANQHSHNSSNPLVSDDQGSSIKRCSKDEKQDTGRTAEISDHSHTFRDFSRRAEYISFGKVLLSLVHARKNGSVTQAESASSTDDGNIDAFTGDNREYKPDIVAFHSSDPEIRSRVQI